MRKFIDLLNESVPSIHVGDHETLNRDNLPATQSQLAQNSFRFRTLDELPPMFQRVIRAAGPTIFEIFTTCPVDEIGILTDVLDDGGTVNRAAQWVVGNGVQINIDRLDASELLGTPLGVADVALYELGDEHYLMTRDAMGHYIYRWPASTSKHWGGSAAPQLGGHQEALPAPQPRLR